MSNAALIWIVVFAISALGFFLIAVVVAVKGFFDLRLLLRHSDGNGEPESAPNAADATLMKDE